MNRILKTTFLIGLYFGIQTGNAQNPNFHIYICFGQSNMEGQGTISAEDRIVDDRFQVMQAEDCSNLSREKGHWYTAVPPLTRCYTRLSPADYFGRTMIENLPSHIKVGVINVSVGGCRIELFDKFLYEDFTDTYTEDWFQDIIASYDGNPYQYLIDLARNAQQDGVIKGILLHQGETNTGDNQWSDKVKKIYDYMIEDLDLDPSEVPILAGELLNSDDDCCSSQNTEINRLPNVLPNAHIISSDGLEGVDNAHFTAGAYRIFGERYASQMITLIDYNETPTAVDPSEPFNGYYLAPNFPNPANISTTFSFTIPNSTYVSIKVYDTLGREVSEAVGEEFSKGEHAIEYEFKKMPKGVYFFTMRADDYTVSRRVVLE